jgi:hypothetical protein
MGAFGKPHFDEISTNPILTKFPRTPFRRNFLDAVGKPYFHVITTRSSMQVFGKPNFDEISTRTLMGAFGKPHFDEISTNPISTKFP